MIMMTESISFEYDILLFRYGNCHSLNCVLLLFLVSRKKKIPRTNSLYTDALNAMVNGDLSNAIAF